MSYSTTYNQRQFASRRANLNRNQNRARFVSSVKLGPVTHTVLVALMITVLGLIYLTQATKTTSYDYEAQKLNSQIAELSEEKKDLEVDNARLTALDTVRGSDVAKAMTESKTATYIGN